MLLTGVLLLALIAVPVATSAAPVASIVSDDDAYGCPRNYPFSEDNLKVVVQDGNTVLAVLSFCSSYAKANAVLEKDAKGAYFLVLRYGEGRGTNARSEYLAVYRIGRTLIEHVRIPVSAPAGPVTRWEYKYTISKPAPGGLVFNLVQDADSDAEWVPAEKVRTIEVR